MQGGDKSDTRWHKPVTVGKRVVSERRNVSERWFDSTHGHNRTAVLIIAKSVIFITMFVLIFLADLM